MNDDELKDRFRQLRRQDARSAPAFERIVARRSRRVSPLVVIAPVLAVAAGFVLWCGANRAAAPAAPPVAFVSPPLPARPLPLDFLLETTPVGVRLDADPTEGLRP